MLFASLSLARVLFAIGVGWVCLEVEEGGVPFVGVRGKLAGAGVGMLEGLRFDLKKSVIFA